MLDSDCAACLASNGNVHSQTGNRTLSAASRHMHFIAARTMFRANRTRYALLCIGLGGWMFWASSVTAQTPTNAPPTSRAFSESAIPCGSPACLQRRFGAYDLPPEPVPPPSAFPPSVGFLGIQGYPYYGYGWGYRGSYPYGRPWFPNYGYGANWGYGGYGPSAAGGGWGFGGPGARPSWGGPAWGASQWQVDPDEPRGAFSL